MSGFRLFTALVACMAFMLAPVVSVEEKFVRLPFSKKEIPVEAITKRLGISSKPSKEFLATLVYEVTSDGLLVGPGLFFNIMESTRPVSHDSTDLSTVVNGKVVPSADAISKIREGGGYTITYDKDSGSIVAIWGNGVFLEALGAEYHNVFVDFEKSTSNPDADDDDVIVPPGTRQPGTTQDMAMSFTDTFGNTVCPTVEIAVAFDNTYCAMFGNSAVRASAAVQSVISYSSSIFQRDLCIKMALVHLEAHCEDPSDPYATLSTAGSGSGILVGFRSIWESRTNAAVHRDLAYLFTGFDDGTTTIGTAYLGAACTSYAYGWVERGGGPTFVHEVGHNLDAEHTDAGIMQPSLVAGNSVFFSSFSITQIENYLRSARNVQFCINEEPISCDNTCPGGCVNGKCVAQYDSSASEGLVPCVLSSGTYVCVGTYDYYSTPLSYGVECPSGFDFMSPLPSDIQAAHSVFCCLPPSDTMTEDVYPVEYGLLRAILRYPDREETLENYIRDTQYITSGELLKTSLVPSCRTGVDHSISPSAIPSTSSVPSPAVSTFPSASASKPPSRSPIPSSSPKPSSSKSAIPSASPSTSKAPEESPAPSPMASTKPSIAPSPSARPSANPSSSPVVTSNPSYSPRSETKCGDILPTSVTFSCSMATGILRAPKGFGLVNLRFSQRNGEFRVRLATMPGLEMTDVLVHISTNPDLGHGDLDAPRKLEGTEKTMFIYGVDAFEMPVSPGSVCCDERIYIYVTVRLCKRKIYMWTRLARLSTLMKCEEPCGDSGDNGALIPFSATQTCPSCMNE